MRLLIRMEKARYVDSAQMGLFDAPPQARGLTPKKVMVNRPGARAHMKTVWTRTGDLPPGQWRMAPDDGARDTLSEETIDRLIEGVNPTELDRSIDQWEAARESYQKTLDAMLNAPDHRSIEIERQRTILDRVDRLLTGLRDKLDRQGPPQKVDPALAPETIAAIARGSKKQAERDRENWRKWQEEHPVDTSKMADWTKLDSHDVLRVPGGRYAAAPITGRKNARTFVVFDVNDREEIVQLRREEVHRWLRNAEEMQTEALSRQSVTREITSKIEIHNEDAETSGSPDRGSYVRSGESIGKVVSRDGDSLVVDMGGQNAYWDAPDVETISEDDFREAAKQRIRKLRRDSTEYRKEAAGFNQEHGGNASRLKTRVQTFSDDWGTGIIPVQHATGRAYEEIQNRASEAKREADHLEELAGLQPKQRPGGRLNIRTIKFAPMGRSKKVAGNWGNTYEVTNLPDDILKKMGWTTVGFEPGARQRYFAVTGAGNQTLFEASSSEDAITKLSELVSGGGRETGDQS